MKKFLSTILAAAFVFTAGSTLTSCGGSNNEEDVLTVGMECGYQPYNWTQLNSQNGAVPIYGHSGQYAYGYDVMIAQKIAENLGKTLRVYAYEWGALVPAVQSGALDLIIAGMSPTDERKEEIDFSDAYYESNLVIVVRKDGAYANKEYLDDFDGAKIAAQAGTFHAEAVKEITDVKSSELDTFPLLRTALESKTIDGYIAEEPGAIADCQSNDAFTYIHLVNNDSGFTIADPSYVTLAVGLKKNSELLAPINTFLATITTTQRQAMMNTAISLAAKLGL